jgi:hypothetical protein
MLIQSSEEFYNPPISEKSHYSWFITHMIIVKKTNEMNKQFFQTNFSNKLQLIPTHIMCKWIYLIEK